jgi:hypothetical protein
MGMYCPECGKRQAVVANITADGVGARKAEDVIAHRLACGHVVGGEEYTEFIKLAEGIRQETQDAIMRIRNRAKGKVAALWKNMADEAKEAGTNAE